MWRMLLLARLRGVALLAVASLGTACAASGAQVGQASGHGGSRAGTPSTPVAPATTEAVVADEADAVLTAVGGFVRTTLSVNDPPDPDHPDLARYRTGAVLADAIESVATNRALGIAYRRAGSVYSHTASVLELGRDRAVVRTCVVDDAQQVAVADGRVLNAAVATKQFEAVLVREADTWKVAENRLLARWEGVAPCDA